MKKAAAKQTNAKADEAKKNIDTATTDEAVSRNKTGTTEVSQSIRKQYRSQQPNEAIDDALKAKGKQPLIHAGDR